MTEDRIRNRAGRTRSGRPDVASLPGGAQGRPRGRADGPGPAGHRHELAAGLNLTVAVVEQLLAELQREYNGYTVKAPDMDVASDAGFSSSPRGFELRNIAGGWRIYSRADFADIVGRFVLEGQTARLTQAALETLAVIAYRQPVSRARVSAIRGVNVDSVVRTLTQRGLIEDSGTIRSRAPSCTGRRRISWSGWESARWLSCLSFHPIFRGWKASRSSTTPEECRQGILPAHKSIHQGRFILHGWLGLSLDNRCRSTYRRTGHDTGGTPGFTT